MSDSHAAMSLRGVRIERLKRFGQSVLERLDMSRESARIAVDAMVAADRSGISSHGIAKLPSYIDRVDAGVMEVDPMMPVESDRPASARLDAANGFGQVAGTKAMRLAIVKAEDAGAGVVSVANSNHFGVAGHYARLAAEKGLIGIAMTNASPALPPYNATQKLLGTNPIAFGIPAGDLPDVVLDMSSTVVARGRIRREIDSGATTIPEGWANDDKGRPITDPHAALAGSLAPVGGVKGAGLSLVIEMLTGLLSGSAGTGEVANLYDSSKPARTSHLMIAIDPDAFLGRNYFIESIQETVAAIQAMDAADGGDVLYPGLIEERHAIVNDRDGIAFSADTAERLRMLASRFGLVPLQ